MNRIKSERSAEYIDNERGVVDGEWTEEGIITAVEIAEQEARDRAIKAFRKSCSYLKSVGTCMVNQNPCKGNCFKMEDFLKAYDHESH